MKKTVSLILAIALLFTSTTAIFADKKANEAKISLEKAIEIARKSFDFNTKDYDFNQSYYENIEGTRQWQLNWNAKNNNHSISINVDGDSGDILYMYQWKDEYSNPPKLAKYSKEEAQKVAENLLKKLQPTRYNEMSLKYENENKYGLRYYYDSPTYNFYFIRKVDGIEFQGDGVNIAIDKNTLEVNNYTFNWSKLAMPDSAKAISLEKAKEIFNKENGIELAYIIKYDQKTKKNTAKLVYTLKNGNRPIDAITGEIIEYGYYYPAYDMVGAGEVAIKSSQELTPEEKREIEENKKYLTREQALEIALKYIKIDEKLKLEYASLYPDYNNTGASWNFSWSYSDNNKNEYSYANISLNAESGEVKSLYSYDSVRDNAAKAGTPKYDMEKSKELAENFLNAVVSEKFAQTEYRADISQSNQVDKPINYNFNFVRMVNGIPCPGNNLNVAVNAYTGEITNFYSNWMNIDFPMLDNIMPLDKAYESLYTNINFDIKYIYHYDYTIRHTDNQVVKLVYSFDDFSGMLDPATGKPLDYNAEIIKEKEDIAFDDIKGHWAENDILTLLEARIIEADSNKFLPDENIKQKDFIKILIKSLEPSYVLIPYASDSADEEYNDYYKQATSRKIINEKEKNMNSEVTREDAAKMIVRAMNLGFIANKSDIFFLNYTDKDAISNELKGYIAVVTGLDIMSGKEGEAFAPKDKLTRAEAAATIVKFLKVDKE
ncbi:MAG: S-layer homology domain-containing protein [Clostridiales bacterium]|nr:S-layer homology domain-containing protein [Clostridiales bacterium]